MTATTSELTDALIHRLEELIAVLETANRPHWRDWMLEAQTKLKQHDSTGITKILRAYGGMGSFNDLVISWTDTPTGPVWDDAGKELDNDLIKLRSRVWELADEINKLESGVESNPDD
jgi:hypothetical protein